MTRFLTSYYGRAKKWHEDENESTIQPLTAPRAANYVTTGIERCKSDLSGDADTYLTDIENVTRDRNQRCSSSGRGRTAPT